VEVTAMAVAMATAIDPLFPSGAVLAISDYW
jgi:hypothetical protein